MHVDLVKLGTEIVTGASILHTLLPPWDAFNDFPKAQKYYRLFIYIVGYAALNGRSTVYQSISTTKSNGGPAAPQNGVKQ